VPKPPKKTEKAEKSKEEVVAQKTAQPPTTTICLREYEAGLVLHGTEVKALREGKANIRDAYVDFKPAAPGW